LEGSSSPNTLTFFNAATVDEPRPDKDSKQEDRDDLYVAAPIEGEPRVPKFSRREKLVEEIVANHPLIARSFVNRIWAMMMGRGIVHPFDQMDSVHQPSHPELLDMLADDFRNNDYNIRRLIRVIANCDAYQRQSQRPSGVDDPATFAWYLQRPLTAEQYARSIQISLRNQFQNNHPLVEQVRDKMPAVMPETIVTAVGEPLFLSNNPALNQFIADSNQADHLLKRLADIANAETAAAELSVAIFGRQCDAAELNAITAFLNHNDANDEKSQQALSYQRLQQTAWAMLTSAEFRFNH